MRLFFLGCVVLLGCARAALAGPATAASHVFEGRDIFNLQWVEDPQIRPDGRAIAYVRMS